MEGKREQAPLCLPAPSPSLSSTDSLSFQLRSPPEWPVGVFGKKAQVPILNMA